VFLERYFFHFRTKIAGNPDVLIGDVHRARERFAACGNFTDVKVDRRKDQTTVEFRFGQPTVIDQDRAYRLKLRRPRKRICAPKFPPPAENIRADALWPTDLYVGSGLSYEAGLPTLCDMHDAFCVDSETQDGFTVGASDPLPRLLAEEGAYRLVRFCQVHTKALFARPTPGREMTPEWLTGACMALRRRTFLDLGAFDETFYVYNEDMAFGRAIREAGLGQKLRTDLLVPHGAGGSGAAKTWMLQMRGASMIRYLRKHHAPVKVNAMRTMLVAGYAGRTVISRARGQETTAQEHAAYIKGLLVGPPRP